ncbi:hypothetical protein FNV43_RR19417 [Rhamnella rubrinervis]|uniref:Uncharacterized protein n=1 Tax=Rhamnella rubrinervis TaxID=2594499 RepID=A0A8K0DSX2_9ROSA|nr:hypothetical protein FNV43_RR19417 [Rhamnella rubrinervis]
MYRQNSHRAAQGGGTTKPIELAWMSRTNQNGDPKDGLIPIIRRSSRRGVNVQLRESLAGTKRAKERVDRSKNPKECMISRDKARAREYRSGAEQTSRLGKKNHDENEGRSQRAM